MTFCGGLHVGSAQIPVRESCGRSSLFGPLRNVNVVVGGWHSVPPVIGPVRDIRLEFDSVADILLVGHLAGSSLLAPYRDGVSED
jgi:hypothetical protein